VTASQDGTTVTVTPSATGGIVYPGAGIAADGTGTVMLDAGDVLQAQSTSGGGDPDPSDLTGTLITADKPVLVAQYMVGQSYPGGSTGDPAFTLAVPILQYRTDYLFHAPANYEAGYVNVIAPTGTAVHLDGAPVSGWTTVGSTGFDVAKVQLDDTGNGDHVVTSALPFGITVYGYGQYTSYWYPGGLDLTPLGL